MKRQSLLLSFILLFNQQLIGQSIEDIVLNHNDIGVSLTEFLTEVEASNKIKIQYLPSWFEGIYLKKDFANQNLKTALADILLDKGINVSFYYNYYVVFYKDPTLDKEKAKILKLLRDENISGRTVIGSVDQFVLGKAVTISGRVTDSNSDEPIIGATVTLLPTNTGMITGTDGRFSISTKPGLYTLDINALNYDREAIKINAVSTGRLNVEMFESSVTLESVTVLDEEIDANVSSAQVGREQLSIETLENLPKFLGELDVIKSIQLLPGVSTIGEGATGFNVRGGTIDQNLVTLDGVQIFNYSHFLGFFSAFNPNTIKSVTLHRGGINAQYGQRLSSILEVQMKDGNKEKIAANGSLGLVSSQLMIEGPIKSENTTFLVAGRTTYSDWLLNQFDDERVKNSGASFYDLNGRVSHHFNDKNNLQLTGYSSQDRFNLANDTTYQWNTNFLSLKFNHLFDPTLIGNFSLSRGSYAYTVEEEDPELAFELKYKIAYTQFAANFEKSFSRNKLGFGAQANIYNFEPGQLNPTSAESSVNPLAVSDEKGIETGLYVSNELVISDKLTAIGGVRFSMYSSLGPQDILIYDTNEPRRDDNVIDSLSFGSNETIKTYSGFEPRLSMRYLLGPTSSVKLGYNRINQYVHLISNTTTATPIDIWKASDYHIKPQVGDQISIGYFRNFKENMYEMSIESYAKRVDNLLEYKDGADLLLKEHIETEVVAGKGRAYGIEFLLKKKRGRLTGWASYTYSQTETRVDGEFREETINNGFYYPSNFNKPHDFTLVGSYELSLRFTLNVNFTYNSGRPVTAPISKYRIGDVTVNNFSERNQYTIPDYHRLDVGLTIRTNHKKNKLWEGEWNVSVYNLYGRNNAFSVFFEDESIGRPAAKQLSILGTFFPSVSYAFKI